MNLTNRQIKSPPSDQVAKRFHLDITPKIIDYRDSQLGLTKTNKELNELSPTQLSPKVPPLKIHSGGFEQTTEFEQQLSSTSKRRQVAISGLNKDKPQDSRNSLTNPMKSTN